jgi:lycopene cyclase domain-containing protein
MWDTWATAAGHWNFNSAYTLGTDILGLPIEEWLFFVAIPYVCVLVWDLLATTKTADSPARARWLIGGIGMSGLGLAVSWPGHAYSLLAGLSACLSAAVLAGSKLVPPGRQWRLHQGVMYGLFVAFNTILTALPIVVYNPTAFSGVRIGTIPLEDWFYNFALLNLSLVIYALARRINWRWAKRSG